MDYYGEKAFRIDDFKYNQKHEDDIVNLDVFVFGETTASILLATHERPGFEDSAYTIGI